MKDFRGVQKIIAVGITERVSISLLRNISDQLFFVESTNQLGGIVEEISDEVSAL